MTNLPSSQWHRPADVADGPSRGTTRSRWCAGTRRGRRGIGTEAARQALSGREEMEEDAWARAEIAVALNGS
jgi:hypothetical protein